jgi:hypothetical protein
MTFENSVTSYKVCLGGARWQVINFIHVGISFKVGYCCLRRVKLFICGERLLPSGFQLMDERHTTCCTNQKDKRQPSLLYMLGTFN